MQVKVIINEGIVTDVLSDGQVDVEIIDIDGDYEDHDELRAYEQELHEDGSLNGIDFTVAHFEKDGERDGAEDIHT